MSHPREATSVLDRDYLEVRSRILDVAAALDRLDRAMVPAGGPPVDRRMPQIRQAIESLLGAGPGRAEIIQRLFSLDYDPEWLATLGVDQTRPKP